MQYQYQILNFNMEDLSIKLYGFSIYYVVIIFIFIYLLYIYIKVLNNKLYSKLLFFVRISVVIFIISLLINPIISFNKTQINKKNISIFYS